MLLGEAGGVPLNFQYAAAQEASTNGTTANPNLCVTCHTEGAGCVSVFQWTRQGLNLGPSGYEPAALTT